METTHIFAQRIKELREDRGLSQGKLADELGISRGALSYYESYQRTADISMLVKFASYFGVTTDYLLGLSDNRTPETAGIGEVTGLSDEAIGLLKEAKQYSDIEIEQDNPGATSSDIFSAMIEAVDQYPQVIITTESVIHRATSFVEERHVMSDVYEKYPDAFEEIYKDGTIVSGKDYLDLLYNRITDGFKGIACLILDRFIECDEVKRYIKGKASRSTGCTLKEKIRLEKRIHQAVEDTKKSCLDENEGGTPHADNPETR